MLLWHRVQAVDSVRPSFCISRSSAAIRTANQFCIFSRFQGGPSTDADLAHVAAAFPFLEEFTLNTNSGGAGGGATSFTTVGWAHLTALPRLAVLSVSCTDDATVVALPPLPALRSFAVGYSWNLTDAAVAVAAGKFPGLQARCCFGQHFT